MPAIRTKKVTPFQERVYALLKQIPSGKVSSYAAMARALNSSPRAIGGANRNNPFAPEVPCHRCIAASGVSLDLPRGSHVRFGMKFVLMLNSISAVSRGTGRKCLVGRIAR